MTDTTYVYVVIYELGTNVKIDMVCFMALFSVLAALFHGVIHKRE